jgi:hypothetical protein
MKTAKMIDPNTLTDDALYRAVLRLVYAEKSAMSDLLASTLIHMNRTSLIDLYKSLSIRFPDYVIELAE